MLLICPVRPGDNNDELRYAMRSWETNLVLDTPLQLMIVGDKPSWCEPDWFYKGNDFKSVPLAVFANVKQGASRAGDLGIDDVVYMNDDFFCLDPVGKVLPVRRNQTLAEHLSIFPPNGAGLWWPRSLALTASWLAEQGFPHPDSYEVHRPMPASAGGMLEALSRWDIHSQDTVPQWRTVYGTLYEREAVPVQDVKLGMRDQFITSPWVSTSDQSWRRYAGTMRQRFQKPSRWEITQG